jgi:dienelactone hydrolase
MAGDFEKAVQPFDETMKKAMSADRLKKVWEGVTGQQGSFKEVGGARTEAVQKYQVVFVTTEFERGKLDTKVVFDADNRIAGLFFVPAGKYESPPYVKSAAFDEFDISVGKGLLALSGTLSLPKGDGQLPAVVLVHGSGPHDRDESIGPNKPFRDLAHGLASQGIAVLRYEKRTKQHQLAMALLASTITVKEETIDDAAAAVDALASHERIDKQRIFVLGHSLGGMLLPRIAKANDKIAAFISLAGSTRPMEDLILEQTKYFLSLDGKLTDDEQKLIEEIEKQVAIVKSPDLSAQTAAKDLPFGVPAKYWLDLRGFDPAEAAKEIEKPMLILQGERDYQVTMEDFGRWKTALGSRPQVKFILYPSLNHLFVEGQGKSSPAEYSSPGNVSEAVVGDIAVWVKSQRPT